MPLREWCESPLERYVLTATGDERRPGLRSILVVQETRRSSTIDIGDIAAVTASAPPLEGVRWFYSLMSMKGSSGEPLLMQILDVSRTYPHCEVLRDNVYIDAPKEMGLPPGMCFYVRRCGTGCVIQARHLKLL